MTLLDWFLIVWLLSSLISGLRFGLIAKLGALLGLVVGIYLASKWTANSLGDPNINIFGIGAKFLLILGVTRLAFGWIGWIVGKIFNLIAIIPGLKTMNRLLGGLLSVLVTSFMISSLLFFVYTIGGHLVKQKGTVLDKGNVVTRAESAVKIIDNSRSAASFMKLSVFYKPLLWGKMEKIMQDIDKTREEAEKIEGVIEKIEKVEDII